MERQRKLWGSNEAVAKGAAAGRRRGDLAEGSIRGRPAARRRVRGLAGVVARSEQIALLPGAPMRYPPPMDHDDTTSLSVPAGWIDAMDESDAQLAAGQTVPLEPLLDELRQAAAQLEAKLAGLPEHTAARHEH